jgi:hypothetical protein
MTESSRISPRGDAPMVSAIFIVGFLFLDMPSAHFGA